MSGHSYFKYVVNTFVCGEFFNAVKILRFCLLFTKALSVTVPFSKQNKLWSVFVTIQK